MSKKIFQPISKRLGHYCKRYMPILPLRDVKRGSGSEINHSILSRNIVNPRLLLVLISLVLFASTYCVRVSAGTQEQKSTVVPSTTFAGELLPTLSAPDLTERASYEDTPLPPPTITPTLGKLISHTPAPPAQCSTTVNPAVRPQLEGDRAEPLASYASSILQFLNDGGTVDALSQGVNGLPGAYRTRSTSKAVWRVDVTGDGVPDIVVDVKPPFAESFLYIFACQGGKYVTLASIEVHDEAQSAAIKAIKDLNGDGTAEIVYFYQPIVGIRGGGGRCFFILEWNGQDFIDLAEANSYIYPRAQVLNGYFGGVRPHGNGTYELVLIEPSPKGSYYGGSITGRAQEQILVWNGIHFTFFCSRAAEPATYRVHAVEDGENESRCGDYKRAMSAYQRAIFDNSLLGWTDDTTLSTQQPPYFNPDERTYLSTYSRYRIIVLHVLLNQLKKAETDFRALQQLYPEGTTGHQYAELARSFWEGYQAQHSVAGGCQRAIAYATGRAEIILPLIRYGYSDEGGYRGSSVFEFYGPDGRLPQEDVSILCPFK